MEYIKVTSANIEKEYIWLSLIHICTGAGKNPFLPVCRNRSGGSGRRGKQGKGNFYRKDPVQSSGTFSGR